MFVKKLLLVISTAVLTSLVSSRKISQRAATCSPVKSAYEETNSIEATIFNTPTHDPDIELCRFSNHTETRRPSCCSRSTERELLYHAKGEYKRVLQEQAQSVIVKLRESNMTTIADEYRSMAQISRKSLMYEIGKMLNLPRRESYSLADQMFEIIDAYFIFDRSSSVFQAMDNLLDGLFVHVVRQSQKLSALEPEYESCIKETRRQLTPPVFSTEAEQLTVTLQYYLLAASYLAESISITEDILLEIPKVEIIDECFRDYVKLQHCQKCYGYVEMRPCREFCEDMYLVCLNQVIKMEKDWGYHMRVINILSEYLLNRADVQLIMNGLSREITSYTQYALNEWPNYRQTIESKCGRAKSSSPAVASNNESKIKWVKPEPLSHTRDMRSLYQSVILSTEIDLKNFFSSLPLRICSNSPRKGQSCWDGLVERINKRKKALDFLDVFAPFTKEKPELIKEMKSQIRRMRDGLVDIFTPRESDVKQNNNVEENSGSGLEEDDSEPGDTTEPLTTKNKPPKKVFVSGANKPVVPASNRGNEEITYSDIVFRTKTTPKYKKTETKPVSPKTKTEQVKQKSPPADGSAVKNKISSVTFYIPMFICLSTFPWRLL